ncbi:MAG: hypothetical protein PWP65_1390 [Clostridia bacterium]|nr:hypothetical protein [Clostridia bacterium]
MPKLAKLNPKVFDLSLALEGFLLARRADGLAQRTLIRPIIKPKNLLQALIPAITRPKIAATQRARREGLFKNSST